MSTVNFPTAVFFYEYLMFCAHHYKRFSLTNNGGLLTSAARGRHKLEVTSPFDSDHGFLRVFSTHFYFSEHHSKVT
jgi:hypothetical protein